MKRFPLLFILIILSSLTCSAQEIKASKERNEALIKRYIAAINLKHSQKPISQRIPDNSKYAIHISNLKVPIEYSYAYFHQRYYNRGLILGF